MVKKIIGISVLIGIFFLLVGCGRQPYKQPGTNDNFGTPPSAAVYQREVKRHFNATLKDPYSAVYEFENAPFKAYSNSWINGKQTYWQGWAVRITVNAKNGFGGYNGSKEYIFTFKGNKTYSFFVARDFHLVKPVK